MSASRVHSLLHAPVALVAYAWAVPALAYLDPGTGSVLLQSLIGALAIAAAGVGAFFGRIRAFLTRRRAPDAADAKPAVDETSR
jgi:hypothetical protein